MQLKRVLEKIETLYEKNEINTYLSPVIIIVCKLSRKIIVIFLENGKRFEVS